MVRLIAVLIAALWFLPAIAGQQVADARLAALQRQVDALSKKIERLEGAQAFALRGVPGKHAWPDLTESEKAALAAVLKTLPKSTKFDIVCNDAACIDLAMDIDDAMEAAGLESVLDHSLGPLGYGIAVQVNAADRPAAETAIAALKEASGGRLDLPLAESAAGASPPGYVTIVIGKYRRSDEERRTPEGR
jgi:hypothetical protein